MAKMKVLVGLTENAFNHYAVSEKITALYDFNHVKEREILTLPALVCEGDVHSRVQCGCGRAFTGLETRHATTMGMVIAMDRDAAITACKVSFREAWGEDMIEAGLEEFLGLCEAIEDIPPGQFLRIQSEPYSYSLYWDDEPGDPLNVLPDELKATCQPAG